MKTKKSLGQHFLIDETVNHRIIDKIKEDTKYASVVEVGPGMGALTKHILSLDIKDYYLIELDDRFVQFLPKQFPSLKNNIIHDDFLKVDINTLPMEKPILLVGNFPYNISTQIVFKIIENRELFSGMIGMFQKEVAKRICAPNKSKDFGLLSVLTQVFFETTFLFDVLPIAFNPPPKVDSGVMMMHRKEAIDVDYKKLLKFTKAVFNQRRKTLKNSLKMLNATHDIDEKYLQLRPEQLRVEEFLELSQRIS